VTVVGGDDSEMSEMEWIDAYMRKVDESLAGAQSEYDIGVRG
jgi:hypothetical protein